MRLTYQELIDWNAKSLTSFIRRTYSEALISEAALQLLWRSLHFFAYCPFPQDPQDGKIDLNAFLRGICLTVFQEDKNFGEDNLHCVGWHNKPGFHHKATFRRILRSIGVPGKAIPQSEKHQDVGTSTPTESDFILWDVVDSLAMDAPGFWDGDVPQEEIEEEAPKILEQTPVLRAREVRREDVSTLISLLLRVRLGKERWLKFPIGDIAETDPEGENLTLALVNSLMKGEEFPQDQYARVANILVRSSVPYYIEEKLKLT